MCISTCILNKLAIQNHEFVANNDTNGQIKTSECPVLNNKVARRNLSLSHSGPRAKFGRICLEICSWHKYQTKCARKPLALNFFYNILRIEFLSLWWIKEMHRRMKMNKIKEMNTKIQNALRIRFRSLHVYLENKTRIYLF